MDSDACAAGHDPDDPPVGGGFISGLMEGLTQPSAPALVGCLGVVLAVILMGATFITRERVAASAQGAWMYSSSDDCGRLSVLALRGAASFGTNPVVWIMGASDTREILCTEAGLNGLIAAMDPAVRVVSLCADAFLLEERAALIEALRPGPAGVIVLGINPRQFLREPSVLADRVERYRLAFRSSSFDEEAARAGVAMPPVTGHYFWDNRQFFLRRVGCFLRWGPEPTYREHRHHARGGPQGGGREFRSKALFSPVAFDRHAGLISRLAERNRRAGGPRIVLLEIPSVESLEPIPGGPGAAGQLGLYRAAVRRLAEREGLVHLDPGAAARLAPSDFADSAHVGDDAARMRFSREFLRQLAPFLHGGRP